MARGRSSLTARSLALPLLNRSYNRRATDHHTDPEFAGSCGRCEHCSDTKGRGGGKWRSSGADEVEGNAAARRAKQTRETPRLQPRPNPALKTNNKRNKHTQKPLLGYEVRCRDADVTDGFGASLSRRGAGRGGGASVLVTITDTCEWTSQRALLSCHLLVNLCERAARVHEDGVLGGSLEGRRRAPAFLPLSPPERHQANPAKQAPFPIKTSQHHHTTHRYTPTRRQPRHNRTDPIQKGPCWYAANLDSNRRWCCGDARHMDLSSSAFAKIADASKGVVAVEWRRADCPPGSPRGPACGNWASCFGAAGGGGEGGGAEKSEGGDKDGGESGGGSKGGGKSDSGGGSNDNNSGNKNNSGNSNSGSPSPSPSASPAWSPSPSPSPAAQWGRRRRALLQQGAPAV